MYIRLLTVNEKLQSATKGMTKFWDLKLLLKCVNYL